MSQCGKIISNVPSFHVRRNTRLCWFPDLQQKVTIEFECIILSTYLRALSLGTQTLYKKPAFYLQIDLDQSVEFKFLVLFLKLKNTSH